MHIYLVRHAKAEPGDPDELRPLAEKGRKQAQELGRRFARDGVDAVVSSPLLRARETANAIAKATGTEVVTDERLAPGATAADIRTVAQGRGERVVVVGHQPDFGRAAAALSGGPEPELPTAGVFEVELK
ncbi:MAG: SixA phosphatase family protein [Gaiellaceae bacterium]